MKYVVGAGLSALLVAGVPEVATAGPVNVTVSRTNAVTIGARQIFSSSVLVVSWAANPADRVDHFEVVATEGVQGTAVRAAAASVATSVALTGLKAQTTYQVSVLACADATCTQSSASPSVSGSTDTEYWRLRGRGHTVAGLTTLVSDGNARLSATRFGPDADAMANAVQLYYGPMPSFGDFQSRLSAAVASGPADAANPESYLTFTSRSGTSGIVSPAPAAPLVSMVATGQGVPVAKELGGFVRLFFEAQGANGRTRIMSLDSRDGYTGLDFNAGLETICRTTADYSTSGGCAPSVVIGVEGDVGGNARISNARQFKIAWPTLDSPHWDMAVGTFMVFTTDRVTGCSLSPMNHGYAVWDGATWRVQYGLDGCPKLFTSAQAAFPFHSGGVKYRLYYGDPSIMEGQGTATLPFLGPKKLIYADGTATGDPTVVDFEDWEPQTSSRDIVFLWPDGAQLDAAAEGYIDDYHFLTPTGSAALQVMYLTITDGAIPPIAASALLTNP
ncbi:MAG: fibronectin type III domain-containing protein [Vicinamibacterales bacterium]|nr:fibronectin type III domain-containing protein [Vicinamibacterales bacterium]